jgi:hypothetical protein
MIRTPDEVVPATERLLRAVETLDGLLNDTITWAAMDSLGTSVYREPYLQDLNEVYVLRTRCIALAQTDGERLMPPIGYRLRADGGPPERVIAELVPEDPGEQERWLRPRAVDDPKDHVAHAEVRLHRPDDPTNAGNYRIKSPAARQLVMAALADRFLLAADDPSPNRTK